MKNILLLTDFSKNAKNAIEYALQLLKNDECVFYLLYVHKASTFSSDNLIASARTSIYESIVKKPKEKLKLLMEEFQNENDKHAFHTIVDFDSFTASINQIIRQKKIELIVIGTNGVTGAKEVIFGSNTINVIRKVNCTTLVIPEGFKFSHLRELLLPLSPNDSFSGVHINELLKFVSTYKSGLHILRIANEEEKVNFNVNDRKDISGLLEASTYKYSFISHIPIHYAVDNYIQNNAIDIAVLFVQKENFIDRFFKGSKTTDISNTIRVPLLVIHR